MKNQSHGTRDVRGDLPEDMEEYFLKRIHTLRKVKVLSGQIPAHFVTLLAKVNTRPDSEYSKEYQDMLIQRVEDMEDKYGEVTARHYR